MSDPVARADETVTVVVIRTGGLIGRRREWRAGAAPSEADRWLSLIDDCPWDEECAAQDDGADRFVWTIAASTPTVQRERTLPESGAVGPWRRLIDAVREAAG